MLWLQYSVEALAEDFEGRHHEEATVEEAAKRLNLGKPVSVLFARRHS